MFSDSFPSTDLSAPPPPWAVGLSVVLLAMITAGLLATGVSAQPGADLPAAPTVASFERR